MGNLTAQFGTEFNSREEVWGTCVVKVTTGLTEWGTAPEEPAPVNREYVTERVQEWTTSKEV